MGPPLMWAHAGRVDLHSRGIESADEMLPRENWSR